MNSGLAARTSVGVAQSDTDADHELSSLFAIFVSMEKILVSIERPEKIKEFLRIAGKLNFIHSVELLKDSATTNNLVNEPVRKIQLDFSNPIRN